jgi:hypothetical protein
MIKDPYFTVVTGVEVIREYPSGVKELLVEFEDASGFHETLEMIQDSKIALSIGRQSFFGGVTENYVRLYTPRPWEIKAGVIAREWPVWKFVLPSEGDPPPIEFPYHSRWRNTEYADRLCMYPVTNRPRTMWQVKEITVPSEGATSYLFRQYVYGPLPRGFCSFIHPGTYYLGGRGRCLMRVREDSDHRYWKDTRAYSLLRVISPEGEQRGYSFGYHDPFVWGPFWARRAFLDYGFYPFGTQEGDYLVFEVGAVHIGYTATIMIEFGDFADDYLYGFPEPPERPYQELQPYPLNPFLIIWSVPDIYHSGEGQCDFWLPRRRPCRFVSIGDPVDWPEPSSQGNTAGLNEVAFGESV